ncbi:MAG: Kdo domain containing protein [Flavobacteriaceae bacterium]|nr:Kdo domain containing protein [Flavobacteriaceae bacterium]MDG1962067.1 Kdo domain containing protein [Flavobacteriaceae bacterium]
MNRIVISEQHKAHRDALLHLVTSFDTSVAPLIGQGDRNVIKAMPFGQDILAVKSFKSPNIINKWVYRFWRKSKAERSFYYAQRLLALNVGTAEPVGFAESYKYFGLDRSFYLSRGLKPDFTFRELIHDVNIPRRDYILERFTEFTFDLHEKGILFHDHSPGNTLIKWIDGEVHFYLVDLNRMSFGPLSRKQRIHNFARLTPLRAMVKAMSKTYARCANMDADQVYREMWAETEQFQYKFHRKRRLKKRLFFWRR